MMFKGYLPMEGKKPIISIKNKNKWIDLQTAKGFDEYGGILKDDLIMIDVDNQNQASIMEKIIDDKGLKCHKLYTKRGIHFYFLNASVKSNRINSLLPIGLEADIKLGSKNTVVPLKLDGTERKLVEVDQVEQLPKWLEPIKNGLNFYLMGEGDGRNQSLFNFILTLQSEGFSKEQIREIIEIINDYVLKVPLVKQELDTILRDDAFKKHSFMDKGKLKIVEFCKYLINEYHIVLIDNQLHMYQDGSYTDAKREIERAINQEIPSVTRAIAQEVYWKLSIMAPIKTQSDSTHIVLSNGLYNIKTKQLEDFTPSYVAVNRIVTAYKPQAYSKVVDDVIERITCNNKHLMALLEEVVGYALYRKNFLGKAFILTGQGANGKSTFLEMINSMIGEENISSLSIQELGKQFKTAELDGKLINIGDDIPSKYVDDNSIFKKLVTGEPITVERKGQDPYTFRNYAKLYFSANEMPKINDSSYGLMRRLVIIPFHANFKKDGGHYDPFILDKLKTRESLEYFLQLAIKGLHRVLENHAFTHVEEVAQEAREFELNNNPIIQFINESKIENEAVPDVFKAYQVWALENGYDDKYMTKNKLSKAIKQHGFTTKKVHHAEKNGTITVFSKISNEQ